MKVTDMKVTDTEVMSRSLQVDMVGNITRAATDGITEAMEVTWMKVTDGKIWAMDSMDMATEVTDSTTSDTDGRDVEQWRMNENRKADGNSNEIK